MRELEAKGKEGGKCITVRWPTEVLGDATNRCVFSRFSVDLQEREIEYINDNGIKILKLCRKCASTQLVCYTYISTHK